ncbi:putative E3 ubiquitin-protein ligase UBR7 [Culicoides brevitarsis]|uniref:putative E3 ubiquitin-protein ligase UBR7 n=1 Tax=Culicoides brevitarsis TaxID=469753 RepID=UPI00307B438B
MSEPQKSDAQKAVAENAEKTSETKDSAEVAGNESKDRALDESTAENDTTLDESCVYMTDLAKEHEENEMEAMVVLGGSDENNCTYSKGYIKRQALYSCLTCVKDSKEDPEKRAGMCLACSLACHEGHDLVELYTKRNFRCDCGGAKMKAVRCMLEPIKFGINEDNKYNQNFSGVYCTCKRPYPDPEDNVVDEMIQCVVCEDWYHGRHLNTPVIKDFNEMICGGCVDEHSFLKSYLEYSMSYKPEKTEENVEIEENEGKRPSDETETTDAKRLKLDSEACQRPASKDYPPNAAIFWADAWREKLCKCEKCLELYKTEKVEFLIDPEDPVQKYEEIGIQRNRGSTSEEREIEALSHLGRTQQVEMITGYNLFKDRLKEFLATFAVNKKTVTEQDIKGFFEKMKSEKAEQQQGMSYFCR